MGMIYYDYEFKSEEYQNLWRCILSNTFENMELYYRKQLGMNQLLRYFKKAFKITPIALKKSTDDEIYKYKLLAIYLLTKYSNEEFELIAREFNISLETLNQISSNKIHKQKFEYEIKLFFKQFEEDYLLSKKSSLAMQESLNLYISRQSLSEEDTISKLFF